MIDVGPPPQLYIPARPALVRAHQGDLDALKRLERERGIKAMLPGMVPVITGGGSPPPSVTWLGSNFSTTNASSFNFGNFTAPAGGLMVALYLASSGSASGTVSNVSIGGSGGTLHSTSEDSGQRASVASRVVSAGAQNVTVTLSGSIGNINILSVVGVWLIENYTSTTPTGSTVTSTGSSTSQSIPLNMAGPGVAVFGSIHLNTNATTWSTATSRYQATTGAWRTTFADKLVEAAITPHTETVSWGGSAVRRSNGGSWG